MGRSPEADREFWREVLLAGGASSLPRWSKDPRPGMLETEVELSDDLVSGLRALTGELAISFSSVLLAAHARVLAALCGQPEVIVGYAARGAGSPMPCRLDTSCRTWRELLAESFCVESAALIHRAFPLQRLRTELGVTGPSYDTVFDPTSGAGAPDPAHHPATPGTQHSPATQHGLTAPGPVPSGGPGPDRADHDGPGLWVSVTDRGGGLALRLRCHAQVWDTEALRRVAGYHLRALEAIAADLDGEHSRTHLLSETEVAWQIHGLAGPHRVLPDVRVHELFEAQVAAAPNAIAVEFAAQRWTFGELNRHANRLGRALLAAGLGREDVVAVVCERTPGWMAAVLAVFKAGGVYLPIEPSYPPDRIATMMARAGCTVAVTDHSSAESLPTASEQLPDIRTLFIEDTRPADDGHPEADAEANLGVEVSADQLAYIYFTSGSTGEPKGAMCEHAGMLNHLRAKIADTGLSRGDALAQTAPQSFDISLWQLLAAPLVGGTTVLVTQDAVLDVARLLDTLVENRVAVIQVVPSYLEAVVAHLERHPRVLKHLRCVSTTGETLQKDLVQRWFARQPHIPLLNAYGLTETSDDTNHELLHRAPDGPRVPLGRPIRNVAVYVVDEHLQPVPLGAPGEIVFSGVCVGRGYINDPERTAAAYLPDPHRPGQRLYRGGDIGRWLPEGTLEFLGRRDSQVKIRGFRVEIGEIENALLGADGVRDSAVVVAGTGYDTHLVAFYTAPTTIEGAHLEAHLRRSLPAYMVPISLHQRRRFPLTTNSKIDRAALADLAEELDARARAGGPTSDGRIEHRALSTAELRVADAWAVVLGIPRTQFTRHDHFFDRGGTSLSAVKLAIILNRAVSHRDVVEHPTLAELADLLTRRAPRPAVEQSPAS